jgi:hypothetical protein
LINLPLEAKEVVMTGASGQAGFFAAPFAIDGESMGVGEWRLADLSPRWLEFCRQLLASGGEALRKTLPAPFDRVAVRFTAAGAAALGTFHVGDQLVASAAYLRGDDPSPEQELLAMFVQSLRRTAAVQQSRAGAEPFGAVFGLTQRPLHVVVPWGTPAVTEEDEEVVQQLGTHLAGAFLCW